LRLDPKKYTNAPHVRFNRQRDAEGSDFNARRFDCNSFGGEEAGTSVSLLSGLFSLIFLARF